MSDAVGMVGWLDAEAVAALFRIRPDYVARYVKAGKLPRKEFKAPFFPRPNNPG